MTETTNGTAADAIKPPYAPFPTVRNFVGRLKEHGLPHRIDKSVMSHISGAAQSHLILALRFLGLIDAAGMPTQAMKDLVRAYNTDTWAKELGQIITYSYSLLVDGIELETATPAQLEDAFRKIGGTEGTLTEKAIRFYLKALDDAKIPYSKHFARTRGPRTGAKRRKPQGEQNNNLNTMESEDDTPQPGMIAFPIHLPGKPQGKIIVPDDFDEDDAALVEVAMAYLKLYAKRSAGKAAKKTAKEE